MSTLSDLKSAQHDIEGFSWTTLAGSSGLAIAIEEALAPPSPTGSPDAIEAVAELYTLASGTCDSTAGDINRVGTDTLPSAWKGGVAESAAQAVGALSTEVSHMRDVLAKAARALTTWADALRWAQSTDQQGIALLQKARSDIGWAGIDVFNLGTAQSEAAAGVDRRVAAAQHVEQVSRQTTSTLDQLASEARAERILSGDVDALSSVVLANEADPGGAPGVDGGSILTDTQLARGSQQLDGMSPADRARFEQLLAQSKSPEESAYLWKALAAGHSMAELESFDAAIHPHGDDAVWLAEHLTPAVTTTDSAGEQQKDLNISYQGQDSYTLLSGTYAMYSQNNVGDCVAASTVFAQLSMDPTLMLKMTTGGTADGDDSPDAFHQRLDNLYISEYVRGQQADGQSGTYDSDPRVDSGLGPKGETVLANTDLGSVDGGTYAYTSLGSSDDRAAVLPSIEQAVDSGKPVPIDAQSNDGIGHQMMIIGRDGDKLEIYNPWGYTSWVTESQFVNGQIGTLTSNSPTGGEHTPDGVEIPQ